MSAGIQLDPAALRRATEMLSGIDGGADKALMRAINRTLDTAKTKIASLVTEQYAIKSRDVKAAFSLHKASKSSLEAELEISGPRIGYSHFKVSPRSDTTGRNRKAVKVEVKKGSPFTVEKGFVWKGNVFRRDGNDRLPVTRMSGPAVAQMAGSEEVMQQVEEHVNEHFSKNLDHEVTALLKGWTK